MTMKSICLDLLLACGVSAGLVDFQNPCRQQPYETTDSVDSELESAYVASLDFVSQEKDRGQIKIPTMQAIVDVARR